MTRPSLLLGLLSGITLLVAGAAPCADWAQWRGPHGDGTTNDSAWNASALEGRPQVLWEKNIGVGYSAVAVRGERLWAIGGRQAVPGDHSTGVDTVYCLDSGDGAERWRFQYRCPLESADGYPGPTASPVVDGDRLYTLGDDTGDLFCFGADDGTVRWRVNVVSRLGAQPPHSGFGFSGSPVIEGNLVLLNINSVGVALDKLTGETVWASEPGPCSYSTPVVFDRKGQRREALFGAGKLFILDVATGAVMGAYPWNTFANENAADPLILGDRIFISSGYGTGCAMLQLTDGEPKLLWKNTELGNLFTSSVAVDGHIYGIDGQRRRNSLRCLDPATGEIRWSHKMDFGSLISSDGKLIILSEKGVLTIATATPESYQEIASGRIIQNTDVRGEARGSGRAYWWTNPVLANGRVYLRSDKGNLVCLDLGG